MKSGCIFLCRCDILKLGWAPKETRPTATVGETTSTITLKKVSDEIQFITVYTHTGSFGAKNVYGKSDERNVTTRFQINIKCGYKKCAFAISEKNARNLVKSEKKLPENP